MAQVFKAVSSLYRDPLFRCYHNFARPMQIIWIDNIPNCLKDLVFSVNTFVFKLFLKKNSKLILLKAQKSLQIYFNRLKVQAFQPSSLVLVG